MTKKVKARPAGDLTAEEIKTLTEQLVVLRESIRETGRTVLTPSHEWESLRKEIAALNKKLNADSAAKLKATNAAMESDVSSP